MTREEFLQGLKEALDGNMDASAITGKPQLL